MSKCIVCKNEIEPFAEHHKIDGLYICKDCCEIYTTVYTLINKTNSACFVKREDLE